MAGIKVKTWTGTITINSEEQIGKDFIDTYLDNMPERLFLQLHYGSKITTSAIYGQTIQNEASVSLSPYGESVPTSIKLIKKENNVFEYYFSTANDVDKVDCYLLYASYNNITGVNSKYRTTNCFDIKGSRYHNTDVYLDKYIATLMFIDNTWATYPNSTDKIIKFDNWDGLNKFTDWIVDLWNKITNRNDLNYARVRGYCYNDHLYINPNNTDDNTARVIFHELGHMSFWKGIKYESLKDLFQDISMRTTLIDSNYLFGDYKNLSDKQKKDACLIELPSEYMEYKRYWLNKYSKEIFVYKKYPYFSFLFNKNETGKKALRCENINFSNFVRNAINKFDNKQELSIKEKNIVAIMASLLDNLIRNYWSSLPEYTLLPRVLLNSIEYDYSDQQVINAINKAQTYDELFISDPILFNTN